MFTLHRQTMCSLTSSLRWKCTSTSNNWTEQQVRSFWTAPQHNGHSS